MAFFSFSKKNSIGYAQSWEDGSFLIDILKPIKIDNVLSISSGGENSLLILSKGVKNIDSIDINKNQNKLVQKKIELALSNDYISWLHELGVYRKKGLIHEGKLEKFFWLIRNIIIPLTSSKKIAKSFLYVKSKKERELLAKKFISRRFRFFMKIALNERVLGLVRGKKYVRTANQSDTYDFYMGKIKVFLVEKETYYNYFISYLFAGRYCDKCLPVVYSREVWEAIVKNNHNINFIDNDIIQELIQIDGDTYSLFNLSNIFDALSIEKQKELWLLVDRVALPNARFICWSNNDLIIPDFIKKKTKKIEHNLNDKSLFYKNVYTFTWI